MCTVYQKLQSLNVNKYSRGGGGRGGRGGGGGGRGGGILAVSTQLDNWKEGGKGSIKLGTSNGNDIEAKRSEASIIRHFLYQSETNKLILEI